MLWGEFSVKFIRSVKTATRKFPVGDMQRQLHKGTRGDFCVCKCDAQGLWGVKWNNNRCKTFVEDAGSSQLVVPAKTKRQRNSGSNYYREVPRPEVCEVYYSSRGKADQHNRTRQYLLKLEKTRATKRRNTRFMCAVLCGMTYANTSLACATLVPDRYDDTSGSFASFCRVWWTK